MNSFDGQLGQVRPRAHRRQKLFVRQDRTRLDLEEELGKVTCRKPFGLGGDRLMHVGGLAIDRDLPRPGQGRPAIFAGCVVGAAIFRHFLVA